MSDRDFEFPRQLNKALNELLEQDPEQAAAVAASGLLDIVNKPYRQSLGPLVAHSVEIFHDNVSPGVTLESFDVFIGAPMSDEELKEYHGGKLVKV